MKNSPDGSVKSWPVPTSRKRSIISTAEELMLCDQKVMGSNYQSVLGYVLLYFLSLSSFLKDVQNIRLFVQKMLICLIQDKLSLMCTE